VAITNRTLPAKQLQNVAQATRCDSYGNLLTEPLTPFQQACDEGTYFTAVNASDNTAITASIATAYSGTASAFIALRNNDSNPDAGSGKRIVLDYIKLLLKTVPGSAADWRAVIDVDNVQARFTSGGTVITPANSNMQATSNSVALVNVGALTTVALSASGRTLGRAILRSAIPVTLDTTIFTFGGVDKPSGGGVLNGTAAQIITINCPPVILGQNACMCLSLFGTSNAATAATYQVEMGWIER